jgi:heme exporter protein D|tara:strand:+ start:12 stop:239 length:228 start_codon:yes stop_codon:yes gene_type:complete
MINDLINMNGYGIYVWPAFIFTIMSFTSLYFIIKIQFIKEKKKFITKFGSLNSERAALAKSKSINREILSNISSI